MSSAQVQALWRLSEAVYGSPLVIVIGLALIGGGIYLAYEAWKERFRRDMGLGQMRARTRRIVEWLGKFGGMARGAVFVTAGLFLVVAALEAKPQQAKGVDSLRTLATTPSVRGSSFWWRSGSSCSASSRAARPSGSTSNRSSHSSHWEALEAEQLAALASEPKQISTLRPSDGNRNDGASWLSRKHSKLVGWSGAYSGAFPPIPDFYPPGPVASVSGAPPSAEVTHDATPPEPDIPASTGHLGAARNPPARRPWR